MLVSCNPLLSAYSPGPHAALYVVSDQNVYLSPALIVHSCNVALYSVG